MTKNAESFWHGGQMDKQVTAAEASSDRKSASPTASAALRPLSTRQKSLAFRYFQMRLSHTVRHTQQSTKLIYMVNGAILAGLYFVLGPNAQWDNKNVIGFFFLSVLALVNFAHCSFIASQGYWYNDLDIEMFKVLFGNEMKRVRIKYPIPSHGAYALIHFILACALLVAAVWVYMYYK